MIFFTGSQASARSGTDDVRADLVNDSRDASPVNESKKDPRSYFKFKKDGSVVTKSGNAKKTFNFPDIKVGFVFDVVRLDVLPVLSLELYEFKKVPFYFDIGIGPHLVYLSIGYNIIPIFEVGVFIWGGFNFIDRKGEYYETKFYGAACGIGFSLIKF